MPNRDTIEWGSLEALSTLLRWRRTRHIMFDSDLFAPENSDDTIAHVWAAMALAYWHTFHIVTAHTERLRTLIVTEDFLINAEGWCDTFDAENDWLGESCARLWAGPLPNVTFSELIDAPHPVHSSSPTPATPILVTAVSQGAWSPEAFTEPPF